MSKHWFKFAAALCCGAASMLPLSSVAQDGYPNKSVTLVVPYPAGGPTDVMGRIAGRKLSQIWGQPVVIDNRIGASGVIGATYVARAQPDGYTLLLGAQGTIAQQELLKPKTTPYRSLVDFDPIGPIALTVSLIWVRSDLNIKNVKELVAYAQANPGKLTYGTSGVGSSPHLASELLKSVGKFDMRHVPFNGVSQVIQSLLGGHIDVAISGSAGGTFEEAQNSGRARPIAVVGAKRYAKAPDLPTLDEQGFHGVVIEGWFGIMAPAKTPKAVVEKLETSLVAAVSDPEVQAQLRAAGGDPYPAKGDKLKEIIERNLQRVGNAMKSTKIDVD